MDLTLAAEPFNSTDAQRLIAALDQELARRYRPEQRFGPNLKREHLEEGRGVFLVARVERRAIGCGALRRLDDATGEVKRMYVDPDLRGQGVGARILGELEASAAAMGFRRLVLETGVHQAEAIAVYRRTGFNPIPCWGEYATSETSVCYEKLLGG